MQTQTMDPTKRRTILVVDDEPDLCELLAEELASAGFNTKTANSGQEALGLLKQTHIDLIVSDIRMPVMDGMTMLKKLGAEAGRVPPVIFVTGYAQINLVDAFDSGAVAIFSKPVDYDALMRAINRCIQPDIRRSAGKVRLEATVEIELEAKSALIKAQTVNVGRGGAFVALTSDFPELGSLIRFRISFSDGNYSPIEGLATCRWIRKEAGSGIPAGIGIEFEELTPTSKHNLISLINDIQRTAFIPKS